jgi:hypothetical protein
MSNIYSISQEQVKDLFTYDDGQLLWKTTGRGRKRKQAGYKSKIGYTQVRIGKTCFYLHRLIWVYFNGENILEIDHIDGDKTNNRIENLRSTTHSLNSINAKFRRTNTSGFRGVSKEGIKWVARLHIDQTQVNLGRFDTKELASEAYNQAARHHYGDFIKLNP